MKKTLLLIFLCAAMLLAACAAPGTDADTTQNGDSTNDSADTPDVPDVTPDAPDTGDEPDVTPEPDEPEVPDDPADTPEVPDEPDDSQVTPPEANDEPDSDVPDDTEEPADEPTEPDPGEDTPPDGEEPDDTDPEPDILSPYDIPAIYITTPPETSITRSSYVGCTIKVVDPSGEYDTIEDAEATIKVRGHSSSQGAKKPYNFKFSSKQKLFGLGEGKKWCLLANMYDKTQIRNLLAYEFADDIGMPYIQSSTFVDVYLNGDYRGLYQLCEPVDVDETKVDIDTDGNEFLMEVEPWGGYSNDHWITTPLYGIVLGFNEPEEPSVDQVAYLKLFLKTAETALASGDYEEVKKYVDVDSFANAYIVQELFKQVDYHTSSTRFYVKDGILHEGPVWDFDLSSGNCSSYLYPDYHNKSTTGISWQGRHCVGIFNQYLFKYDEFKALVAQKLTEFQPIIVNLYEDNELGRSRIDAWLDEYAEDVARNNEKWTTKTAANSYEHTPVDGTYEGEIEYLRDWLKNRNAWLLDYYCPADE